MDTVLAAQAGRWLRILASAPAAKGLGDGGNAVEGAGGAAPDAVNAVDAVEKDVRGQTGDIANTATPAASVASTRDRLVVRTVIAPAPEVTRVSRTRRSPAHAIVNCGAPAVPKVAMPPE